ncbi:MAG: hydroxymethylbilane synthase [Nitrososphaerota archaeon]|nr:hydroxymethylbilane synthase [Nitrososphaerota archaeon]
MSISANKNYIVGTRGSPLALAQTNLVVAALNERFPETKFEIKVITTVGDKPNRHINASGKDSFTGTIDEALLGGEVDFAVHSLKDVPAEQKGVEIAAFPKRDSPMDALVSKEARTRFFELPEGACIGTSSARRAVQLKAARPDLNILEVTGNIQTRLSKLREPNSKFDAMVLAEAGLRRLGLCNEVNEILSTRVMLPAPGQGCLAVAVRKDDQTTRRLVSGIDDPDTRLVAICERSFSRALGGGCDLPVAALAKVIATNGRRKILLEGLVKSPNPRSELPARGSEEGELSEAENVGKTLAAKLGEFA